MKCPSVEWSKCDVITSVVLTLPMYVRMLMGFVTRTLPAMYVRTYVCEISNQVGSIQSDSMAFKIVN